MPDARNKVVFAAMAAVATALVVGLTVSIWQAVRATNAEQTASEKAALAVAERNIAVEARRAADEERERADQQRAHAERHLYFANMNCSPDPWEQNNLGRVRQLLEETAAFPDRGFEWYYWQRQTHLELMTLRGHLGSGLGRGIFPGRPEDCHRQCGPDGQGVGGGQRQGIAHPQRAQPCHPVCGLFPGRPADCHRQ